LKEIFKELKQKVGIFIGTKNIFNPINFKMIVILVKTFSLQKNKSCKNIYKLTLF